MSAVFSVKTTSVAHARHVDRVAKFFAARHWGQSHDCRMLSNQYNFGFPLVTRRTARVVFVQRTFSHWPADEGSHPGGYSFREYGCCPKYGFEFEP